MYTWLELTYILRIELLLKFCLYFSCMHILDISGINEKFNIGIYCGTKDYFFCIVIGPDLHSYEGEEFHPCTILNRRIWLLYHITLNPEMNILPKETTTHTFSKYHKVSTLQILLKLHTCTGICILV